MKQGERTPEEILDFLAVESYLNGFGKYRLQKLLKEKGFEMSLEGVRRVKNKRRLELEEKLEGALKRVNSENEIERLHTQVSLRTVDLIVSNLSHKDVLKIYEMYLTISIITIKALFDLQEDFSWVDKNISIVEMFVHHREIDEGVSFETDNRAKFAIIKSAFSLLATANATEIIDQTAVFKSKAKAKLEAFYEIQVQILKKITGQDFKEDEYFFKMIKGMCGFDEDFETWKRGDLDG